MSARAIHVSIVIPTYNRAKALRSALRSVQGLRVPLDMSAEVLVVENNCTDETEECAGRAGKLGPLPVRLVREARQGLCWARNRGLAAAEGEYVVFLDDDMVVGSDWLYGLNECVESWDIDAAVGPVRPIYATPVPSFVTSAALASVASTYSLRGSRSYVLAVDHAHELPGCNFAVRRSVALGIGGFSGALDRVGRGMLAGGDFEFGLRLRDSGAKVAFHPHCSIGHHVGRAKLSRAGLSRRWFGLGRTEALIDRLGADTLSTRTRARMRGILRRALVAALQASLGLSTRAFESQLKCLRSAGYAWEVLSGGQAAVSAGTRMPHEHALGGDVSGPGV